MAKGIIKQIFIDHWDGFTKEYGNNIRESVFHEVKKMMQCGSLENGFLEFKCDTCGETKKVGFTCKSRLCSLCGKIRIDDCVEDLIKRMARAHHRHVIFTIPEDVVNYFDTLDGGDTSVPPRFICEECSALMEPVEYKGVHGITYKIEE